MRPSAIGVIIPFFQKEPGLLRRSILSVAGQEGIDRFRIYIVDDESPVSLENELSGLPDELCDRIEIRRQANAGPGAARNLALDMLDDDVAIVTFLDSDDAWREDHLANIKLAFDSGAEFYFSDYRREGAPRTCFEKMGFTPNGTAVREGLKLLWYESAAMFENLLMYSPIGTPTVAYSRTLFGKCRFDNRFRSAGEDKILWAEILSRRPKLVVSMNAEVQCGRGVNVFAHGSWGDERAIRTSLDCARSQMYLSRSFPFSAKQREDNARWCRKIDLDLWAAVFAMLRRRGSLPAKLIARYLAERPGAILRFPLALVRAVSRKIVAQQ